MAELLTQDNRMLRFDSGAGLPKDMLLLLAVVGQEGISRPYSYKVELLCQDPELAGCVLRRIAAVDTYVPLAAAANLVLVQEPDIERAALALCEERVR